MKNNNEHKKWLENLKIGDLVGYKSGDLKYLTFNIETVIGFTKTLIKTSSGTWSRKTGKNKTYPDNYGDLQYPDEKFHENVINQNNFREISTLKVNINFRELNYSESTELLSVLKKIDNRIKTDKTVTGICNSVE